MTRYYTDEYGQPYWELISGKLVGKLERKMRVLDISLNSEVSANLDATQNWYTGVIDCSSYNELLLCAGIFWDGTLNAADYITFDMQFRDDASGASYYGFNDSSGTWYDYMGTTNTYTDNSFNIKILAAETSCNRCWQLPCLGDSMRLKLGTDYTISAEPSINHFKVELRGMFSGYG